MGNKKEVLQYLFICGEKEEKKKMESLKEKHLINKIYIGMQT